MRNTQTRWQRVSVAEVCESIVDCVNKTAPTVNEPTTYKMIRTTNVKKGWVNFSDVKYVTKETFDRWTRRQLPLKGDVILTREAPLGEVGMLRSNDHAFLGQRLVAYRADPAKLDNRFLLYTFQGHDVQAQIKGLGSGATVEHMRVPDCEKLTFLLPSLSEQRRIASILSAYDDLIENNTRRIAILEEMARRIYEKWFVHFRFPGHEQAKMVESELGLIPEGWEITNLDSVTEYINRGLTPKYDDMAEGLVINQKCIRGQKLSYELARKQSKPIPIEKRIRYGDVVINSTGVGTLGRVAQVLDERDNCTADTHVTIVRPGSQVKVHFFGMALLAMEQYFEQQGVGATGQTELGRSRVAETVFVLSPYALQEKFDTLVAPMRGLVVKLATKNANLRATRDLLLPKLISGELDVSSLPEPEEGITA